MYNNNHRIIGQVHGGNTNTICNANDNAFFGRFDLSWTGGGTNSTRLSNWLDPGNTGAITTNTTDVSNLIPADYSISGSNSFCTNSSYSIIPNPPTGITVTWSVTPAGVVTVDNSNPPQATLTGIANGNVTLVAAISSACGNPTLTLPIHVGAPNPITGISYDYSMVHCMVVGYKITLVGGEYATSYKWYTRNISQGEQNFTLFRNTFDNHLTMGAMAVVTR